MKDHIFLSYNNLAHKNVMTSKLKNVEVNPEIFIWGMICDEKTLVFFKKNCYTRENLESGWHKNEIS